MTEDTACDFRLLMRFARSIAGAKEVDVVDIMFSTLWARIEQHAVDRSEDAGALESLIAGVKGECDAQVREQMDAAREAGSFENVDWFGRAGRELGMQIVTDLESRLSALRET